jgi:hypothetical protein
MLRAATRFHANHARCPFGEMLHKPLTFELHTHDLSALLIDPVQLKHPLGNVNANYCFAVIHLGPSGLLAEISVSSTLGVLMPAALSGGGVHTIS